MNKNKRKNGFSRPFGIYQVSSWVFVIFQLVSFHLTTVPLLPTTLIITSVVVVVSSFLLLVFFWQKVSFIDLSDISNCTIDTGKLCNYCLSIVNFHSKHCQICNKCVYRFDHHCAILNTCIGKFNYKDFIFLLISMLVFNVVLGIFCLKTLIDFYRKRNETSHSNQDFFNYFNYKVMIILNLSSFVLAVVVCICISTLLTFNCYLKVKGMTTYELILNRQLRKRQKTVAKTQNESGVNRTEIENSRITPVLI